MNNEELRHAIETAIADLQAGVDDTEFIVRYLTKALKMQPRNCGATPYSTNTEDKAIAQWNRRAR